MPGIFSNGAYKPLFTRYRVQLQFRDRIMGGVPMDPKLIEGWIKKNTQIEDPGELKRLVIRTLEERTGGEIPEDVSYEDLDKAVEEIASTKETTGFKRDPVHGLYIEDRQIKAAFKESTNVLFAGEKWGATKKGPKNFLAERLFVAPRTIWLGRKEADGVEMVVGHVTGPQGPRSTLGYHEYVDQATITFDVLSTRDSIEDKWWPDLFQHMEENGLGALRSQSFGRFDTLAFDKIDARSNAPEPPVF